MSNSIEEYFNNLDTWQKEIGLFRRILLDCGLNEELKWKQPCYTYKQKNIAIIANFKSYCSIGFFKGALLKDEHKILSKPGDNSQAVRQARFTNIEDILKNESVLKSYIFEAIEVEKAGLQVSFNESKNLDFPEELEILLEDNTEFKNAFEALTPGRQRGYILFFSAAKQSSTRIDRIEKYRSRIMQGKGINDCVCGHSKKMPGCDGSHKQFQ